MTSHAPCYYFDSTPAGPTVLDKPRPRSARERHVRVKHRRHVGHLSSFFLFKPVLCGPCDLQVHGTRGHLFLTGDRASLIPCPSDSLRTPHATSAWDDDTFEHVLEDVILLVPFGRWSFSSMFSAVKYNLFAGGRYVWLPARSGRRRIRPRGLALIASGM